LERAKQEADRVLLGLSERRETLVQHLQDMQTRLVGVAKELEVAIEDPDAIEASLSDDPEPVSEAAAPAVVQTAPVGGDHRGDGSDPDEERDPIDGIDGLEGMLPDDSLDMPDIPSLELDFDDDPDD
jgi:hypothetical protein